MPPRQHRTTSRIVQILEVVASRPRGISLANLSRAVGAPKSTIQGFVNGLVYEGYLSEEDQIYLLGPGAFILPAKHSPEILRIVTHDRLRSIHEESGYGALLGVLVGRSLVYLDAVVPGRRQAYFLSLQSRRPALRTSGGRLLVSQLPVGELQPFIDSETPEVVDGFLSQVDHILANDYSYVEKSLSPDATALAVPVRSSTGTALGSLVVTAEPGEFTHTHPKVAEYLKKKVAAWTATHYT